MENKQVFEKCKMCSIPLNSEIKSKKDPQLCFECAEEPRNFTTNELDSPVCRECGVVLNDYNSEKDCPDICKKCNTKTNPISGDNVEKKGFFSRLFSK